MKIARRGFLGAVPSVLLAASVPSLVAGCATLEADPNRRRAALLLPLSGPAATIGRSLARAAEIAAPPDDPTVALSQVDTAPGAAEAAAMAMDEGAEILLGPLFGDNVAAVVAVARGRAPVVTFSNDANLVGGGGFVLGVTPPQSVGAVLQYARRQGVRRVAVVAGTSAYGHQAAQAARGLAPLAEIELTAVLIRTPGAGAGGLVEALRAEDGAAPDAVLLPEGGESLAAFAPPLAAAGLQLLGTDQWLSVDFARIGALDGAWYAAPAPAAFASFAAAFEQRYDATPGMVAGLAYDAAATARTLAASGTLSRAGLTRPEGFPGAVGAFRFREDGSAARDLAILAIQGGRSGVVEEVVAV